MEEFKKKYIFVRLSEESDCIKLEFLSYVCSSGWLSLFAILRVFEWTERSNRTHMGFLCITSYRLQVKIGFWHTRNLRILLCLVDCICIGVSIVEEFFSYIHRNISFLNFPACFWIPIIFSNLNSNCFSLLDIRTS